MSPSYGSPVGPPLGSVQSGSKADPGRDGVGDREGTQSTLITSGRVVKGVRGEIWGGRSVGVREDDEVRWREFEEGGVGLS